jgi:hypothetical protein
VKVLLLRQSKVASSSHLEEATVPEKTVQALFIVMQFRQYGNLNYSKYHQYSYTTERSVAPHCSQSYPHRCLLTEQGVKLTTHLRIQPKPRISGILSFACHVHMYVFENVCSYLDMLIKRYGLVHCLV